MPSQPARLGPLDHQITPMRSFLSKISNGASPREPPNFFGLGSQLAVSAEIRIFGLGAVRLRPVGSVRTGRAGENFQFFFKNFDQKFEKFSKILGRQKMSKNIFYPFLKCFERYLEKYFVGHFFIWARRITRQDREGPRFSKALPSLSF